jgi:fatty aldehyde-generating acyl-ACP reductase
VVAHLVRVLAGPPGDAVITIVGASGDVGSGACRVLHEHGYRPVLVARNQERLQELAQTLPGTRVMTWEVAAPITDIAVLVAGTSKGEISLDAVPRDAYILDVGHPHNADGQGRARYAVAGRARFAHHPQIEIPEVLDLVCRPGETHACLAETVILGFEQCWQSYSMGRGNITPDKVRELLVWGERHGVTPAPLHFGVAHHGAQHAAPAKDAAHG